jgi:hypothetical protein
MEKQLESYQKRFMLKTMGGIKTIISDKQELALRQASSNKMVALNGIIINTSVISEIIELEEYYRQYPEDRPVINNYKEVENFKPANMSQERRIKAIESMIKGFKKSMTIGNKNSEMILKKLELSLNKLKKGENISLKSVISINV